MALRKRTRLTVGALVLAAASFTGLAARGDPSSHQRGPTAAEQRWAEIKATEDQARANLLGRYFAEIGRQQLERFYAGAYWHDVERLADAWNAAHQPAPKPFVGFPSPLPPRRAPAPSGRTSGSVGGPCGGATNGADAYIGRESGGNPNARNASGAWGCYQIMPGTWASSCSDLGQHGSASTEAQAACASRLPSSAWAASGG